MISKHGVKISAVYKCNKCGWVAYWYGSGRRPKKCYMRICSGTFKRKS